MHSDKWGETFAVSNTHPVTVKSRLGWGRGWWTLVYASVHPTRETLKESGVGLLLPLPAVLGEGAKQ